MKEIILFLIEYIKIAAKRMVMGNKKYAKIINTISLFKKYLKIPNWKLREKTGTAITRKGKKYACLKIKFISDGISKIKEKPPTKLIST